MSNDPHSKTDKTIQEQQAPQELQDSEGSVPAWRKILSAGSFVLGGSTILSSITVGLLSIPAVAQFVGLDLTASGNPLALLASSSTPWALLGATTGAGLLVFGKTVKEPTEETSEQGSQAKPNPEPQADTAPKESNVSSLLALHQNMTQVKPNLPTQEQDTSSLSYGSPLVQKSKVSAKPSQPEQEDHDQKPQPNP